MSSFTLGLHEVGNDCHAYLQPDGGWGWSNAGLVRGDGVSLLVDTLFDLRLTAAMLDAMRVVTDGAPISSLVNTHANGDHCYGNSAVRDGWPEVEIISSSAAAEEMPHVPPVMLHALNQDPGDVGDLFRSFFGEFDFGGIELELPSRTFDDRLDIDVGGRRIELIEVGPAHTQGDVIVHVPDANTVYTGDILFVGWGWASPQSCRVTARSPDRSGIVAARDYLSYVETEAAGRRSAGMDAFDAAREIGTLMAVDERFAGLGEFGRIAVNVDTVYRSLDPTHETPDVVEQFRRMAELEAH